MGRSRTTSKKNPGFTKTSAEASIVPPSIPALFEKTQACIAQCDYDLARRFIERILETVPNHVEAREMLGIVQLETGALDAAKRTFLSLISPNQDASTTIPPSAYLYLAQLSDDDPLLALQYYQSAVDILVLQLKGKERDVESHISKDDENLKNTVVRALISMVEIWMDPSYDLCFDPEAEKTCETLLNFALQTDPSNAEALQTLASVRLSQQRPDEARGILEKAWERWQNLDSDDASMPSIETRFALVKLFLELSLFKQALHVLQGIIETDDQQVEAWYLEGWCFFLMAEEVRETGAQVEGLGWAELAKDARECLETCQKVFLNEQNPDKPLLGHVEELIGKLDTLGVGRSDERADEDDGAWQDVEGSEDDDDDVEMS